jgi:hypothetical protein
MWYNHPQMILNFIIHDWPDIIIVFIIFVLSTLPVFPPFTVGFTKEYYDTNQKRMIKGKWFNLIEVIPILIFQTMLKGAIVAIGFRGTVTLVLFVVLGTDLFINKQVTNNDVILTIVAIFALYLEKILEGAEEISIWKIFSYKAKKNQIQQTT